ncbi:MAG TPA: DUF6600 domain-containing protein [Candidatus Baltobacteraceae bacterium]|nr:DUF6600 domain-containing protein [Candidatus Baltobacteraceae bacterium]
MIHSSIKRAPFALILSATLAAAYVGAIPAYAQDYGQYDAEAGANAPPVARLAIVEGQVALKHGDRGDQATAIANAPIEAGDYITTGDDGRAEVQLDADTIIRAGADTQLRFTQLDDSGETAQIAQGTIQLRVFATGQSNVQVQTPSVNVEPSEAGAYLITVTADGTTQLTARSGSLAVTTPQGSQEVDPGQTMVVAGSATNPRYQYIGEVAQTDLEQWGDTRDQQIAAAESTQSQYVGDDMVGSSDLSQYGQWVDIPGYGDAWVPNGVAPDWTPYSAGSWVSLNYYGPTWVGAEPWGWAPYHYGRWFYAPTVGWAWSPGPPYARAVWSPALVAFFGFGGGTHIGIGFGNVGWVPLAPGEFYRPWWGRGASLSFGLDFTRYRNYAHGYSSVSYAAWQHGSPGGVRPSYSGRGGSPGWQRFGGGGVSQYARPAASAGGWQRFGGVSSYARPSYARQSYARPSYARPSYARASYQQRAYQGSYQRQYAQRSYAPRSYAQRSYQPSYQRQYAAQRQYAPQYRAQGAYRSGPSRSSTYRGSRPGGRGRP